jgi:hypothetical protein
MPAPRALLAAGLVLGLATPALAAPTVFRSTLVGIEVPGTSIRGVPGGGRPWSIEQGDVKLEEDGTLKVKVKGLIIPDLGNNPSPTFVATVSCLNPDGTTAAPVRSAPVPATAEGDARIRERLDLPEPCLAPVVFVGNEAGRWFAVSGF